MTRTVNVQHGFSSQSESNHSQEEKRVIGSNAMAVPERVEPAPAVPVSEDMNQEHEWTVKPDVKQADPLPFQPQERELLSIFAGENSSYYLNAWSKPNSMNWAAFLLTIFWMGYRKLMAPMIIAAGTYILAGLIIAASGIYWLIVPAVPLFMAASGFLGNRLYLYQAREKIDKVQSVHGSWEVRRKLLAAKGGTSPSGVFIVFGVMIGYLFISVLLFSIL